MARAVKKQKQRLRQAPRQPRKPAPTPSPVRVQQLLIELQVHAEQITVQNEQLINAKNDLQQARDRFADLYDFAPIGYVSLDHHNAIVEINLAGAALLGHGRASLLNLPLTSLIATQDRAALQRFLVRARQDNANVTTSVEVTSKTDDARILRLTARPGLIGGHGQLLTAMADVTEERRLDDERRDALSREQARTAELGVEVSQRTADQARIKKLLERLVTAQEEERRRIARNLHDHLGQQLTALRLTLNAIKDDMTTSTPLRERIAVVEDMVSKIDRDVDLLAWDLRPVALDDMGLPSALADLVRQWTTMTAVPAEFHHTTPLDLRLKPDVESNIYRIVQEALNNIAKHAGATHVSVLIEHRGNEAAVIIEDDGRGFDPDATLESHGRHAGMGLVGMRERAALIDGEVEIESQPGQGTTVFVRIPAPSPARPPD